MARLDVRRAKENGISVVFSNSVARPDSGSAVRRLDRETTELSSVRLWQCE
jgi:hypothetical protein